MIYPAYNYDHHSQARQVRDLLLRARLSQRGAAKALEIGERTMRRYCAGEKVPVVVLFALRQLVYEANTC